MVLYLKKKEMEIETDMKIILFTTSDLKKIEGLKPPHILFHKQNRFIDEDEEENKNLTLIYDN